MDTIGRAIRNDLANLIQRIIGHLRHLHIPGVIYFEHLRADILADAAKSAIGKLHNRFFHWGGSLSKEFEFRRDFVGLKNETQQNPAGVVMRENNVSRRRLS